MRLLLLAPPGAGKGTQAERLSAHFGIEHLASGELFRQEVTRGTTCGRLAREYLDRGDLVPDEVVLGLMKQRLAAAAGAGGYVLDGFPRTVGQARAADEMEGEIEEPFVEAVIYLQVKRAELRRRMLARASREGRTDDTETTIDHRLDVFDSETHPLLDYYDEAGSLAVVDGEASVDEVNQAILVALGVTLADR